MIRGLTLFLSAVFVSSVGAVDCSKARPYVKTVYPDSNTSVHYNNVLYRNQYWAPFQAIPGESNIWVSHGSCDAGTAGNGPTIDCSSYQEYTSKGYSSTVRVKHQGHGFENRWHANPGEAPFSNEVWLELGVCGSGSTGTPAPSVTTTTKTTATTKPAQGTNSLAVTTTTTKGSATTRPITTVPGKWPAKFFAPFMDATLGKRPKFTDLMAKTGTKYFALGFVVASSSSCSGSWGTYYSISQGPWTGFLSEIEALRKQGGDVIVSFGGAANVELANAAVCQSGNVVENLKKAYAEVIDTYSLTAVDFDIEGEAISEVYTTNWRNRFNALKSIVAERPGLQVSYTLPVLPTGLLANALKFVEEMFKADAPMNKVNIMTMNYGSWPCPGDVGQCEIEAVKSLASQLYNKAVSVGKASQYGWSKVADVYPFIGSTPMIGVHDVNYHVYTLNHARTSLAAWKSQIPIGWLSMWSVARDSPCASIWADASCSGASVQTRDYEYMEIFAPYTSA